jgi:hypothetical protein
LVETQFKILIIGYLIQNNGVNLELWTLSSEELLLDNIFFENLHSNLERSNWVLDTTHETLTTLTISNLSVLETEGLIDLSLILGNLIDTYLAGLLAAYTVWYRAARTNLLIFWNIFVYTFVSKNQ